LLLFLEISAAKWFCARTLWSSVRLQFLPWKMLVDK
jgi:hypothetical protein